MMMWTDLVIHTNNIATDSEQLYATQGNVCFKTVKQMTTKIYIIINSDNYFIYY